MAESIDGDSSYQRIAVHSLSTWHHHVINVLQIDSLRKLIPANQLIASPSKPRNLHLIDTHNKNPTYSNIYVTGMFMHVSASNMHITVYVLI